MVSRPNFPRAAGALCSFCAALAVLASAGLATAAPLQVDLLACGTFPDSFPSEPIQVAALPEGSVRGATGEALSWTVEPTPRVLTLGEPIELDRGSAWTLFLSSSELWARPIEVSIGEAAVRAPVWPRATLEGTLEVPTGESVPSRIDLRWTRASDGPPAAVGSGDAGVQPPCRLKEVVEPCAVDPEGRFRCGLPEGSWNVVIKAPGWAARRLWRAELGSGERLDIGSLALRHGATLVGQVTTVDGPAEPEITRVWAVPVAAVDHRLTPRMLQEGSLGTRTGIDDHGFFVFEDLRPGEYVVVVHQPGYALNDRFRVRLEENRETALREPVVLTPPTRLEIAVDPPTDPRSRPWEIRLRLQDPVPGSGGLVARGVTADGEWAEASLEPGTYQVDVYDSTGSRVRREGPFEVGSQERVYVPIEIESIAVNGEVSLGDERVPAAKLWFGGRTGLRSIQVETDEDGMYETHLPEGGDWRVEVEAQEPPISYTGEVKVPESGGELDLRLPDTRISGFVLDESGGAPSPLPTVGAYPVDRGSGSTPITVYEDGSFEARGVEPGVYRIQATSAHGTSRMVEISVQEEMEGPQLRLVLRQLDTVGGLLLSRHGGVAGATVIMIPFDVAGRLIQASVSPLTTGPDGAFRGEIPAGTEELLVTALPPGFGLTVARTGRDPGEIRVAMPEVSVRLEGALAEDFNRSAVLLDGEVIPVGLLANWARMNGISISGDDTDLVVPNLPAGAYRYCRLTPQELQLVAAGLAVPKVCSQGVVNPGGDLELPRP